MKESARNFPRNVCLLKAMVLALLIAPGLLRAAGVVNSLDESALYNAINSGGGGGLVTFTVDGTIVLTDGPTGPAGTNATTIDGAGHSIVLSGGNNNQLFWINSGQTLILKNLTIANGKSTDSGGAIFNHGTVIAYNCFFTNNNVIGTNTADAGNAGGSGQNGGTAADCLPAYGGAIYNDGTLSVISCEFDNNTVKGGNGGKGGNGSDGFQGGGGGAGGNGGLALGGAVYSTNAVSITNTLSVTRCTFFGNKATGGNGGNGGDGGNQGISFTGTGGKGGIGGEGSGAAVFVQQNSTMASSTFYGNVGTGGSAGNSGNGGARAGSVGGDSKGGGVCNMGTNQTINSTFYANTVQGGHGGNASSSGGNGGKGGDGDGGGMSSSTQTGITNCTFSAGGAYISGGGAGGSGGSAGGSGNIQGGNICRLAGTFAWKNTLTANSVNNSKDTFGNLTDGGCNLCKDGSPSVNTSLGSQKNIDPLLGTFAYNGGFTPTLPVLSNSPAINRATNSSAPPTDQRGYYRTYAADSGSYEYNGASFGYTFIEITAPISLATEAGPTTGMFSITRTGKLTETNLVSLDLSGTAVSGVDYTALPTNILFLPNVAQSNLTVTPLSNAPIASARTIVLGLKAGTNFLLGLHTNAVVTIEQDGPSYRSGYPLGERYLRGTGTNLDYYTIVVTLGGFKGTGRANFESNSMFNTFYHYNGALGGSQTTTNNRIACNTPVASFGSGWGTPLRPGTSYSMGVHVGTSPYKTVYIDAYYRSNLTYVGTVTLSFPDGTDWNQFATNGFSRSTNGFGLTSAVRAEADSMWGTSSPGYVLTHTASGSATNYYYLVSAGGIFGTQDAWLNSSSVATYGPIYDMVFDAPLGWRSMFVEQPQFNGQPLPPDLLNKTPDELLNYGAPVTNSIALSPSACTNLDQSPELRRHPILDQFVSDLNNDPIALANYVQNEIELTDAIAYRDDGSIASESVNLGGVNRSALGVYLEGQGSPMEQCALLTYLLRQAGYPAVYVFPPDGGLKILDTRLSQLLRMQFKGAQDQAGHLYTTNRLIAVNYPWVAVNVSNQWIHLFPWLKQTAVSEGLNLYDYLPDPYKETQLWVKDYVFAKTNITAFATPTDDTVGTVFPRYLANALQQNSPGISVDDIGMTYVNRRNLYTTWDDFPRPTLVTNTSTAVVSLTDSSITNVSTRLTNVFDTVYVEVFSVINPSRILRTPEMRMCDLHNRKFFLTHTNIGGGQVEAIMTLAAWRPDATNTGSFATSDTAFTNKQVAVMTLDGTDDELRIRLRHRRQRALTWQTPVDYPNGFLELNSEREVLQERKLRKGDLAAICLNAGRVTPAMLRIHAQDIWNMEQQLGTNSASASTIPLDVYQGTTVYLMGMSYYERCARFDDLNRRLNKVQNIASYAMGLAKLSPNRDLLGNLPDGPIDPVWPNVDMFFRNVTLAGNSSVRMDSGWDPDMAARNYLALSVADLSSQEHAILNTFFGQSAAVSTVKVLQLAQSKVPTGGSNVVELTYFNFETEGNKLYNGVALRNQDPSMWAQVESFFGQESASLFSIAWLTPGIQTTPSGSFSGMAALLLGPNTQAGLIGNNLYGAFANNLAQGSVGTGNLRNWMLTQQESDLTLSLSPPQANQFRNQEEYNATTVAVLAAYYGNNSLGANPFQTQLGQSASSYFGETMDYATTLSTSTDRAMNGTRPDDRESNGWLSKIADPVNALTGEFYVDDVDLSLPGPMPLQVRRNYGSQNLANSQLGYGWKLNYMPFLTVTMSNIVYESEPSGSVIAFDVIGTNLWMPTLALNPTLNNDSSRGIGSVANPLNARLVKITTNSANYYYLTNGDGSLRVFQEMSFPLTNSAAWDRLRPYLTTWFDNRGNFYRFEYGTNNTQADYGQVRRIVSSSGNIVRFDYDVYGHVVDAFSLDGRRVQYEYDQHGDLVTVTRPDTSQITYEYQLLNWVTNNITSVYSTHLVLKEDKPDGRVLQNEYDSQRRVTNQWSTVGPDLRLVRSATFRYTNDFNLTNLTGTINGTTTILDYANNPTTYFYTNGLIRRVHDPLGGEQRQDWYEANETNAPAYPRSLKTVTTRRGLVTTFLYDSSGNVTNTTTQGDLLGDGNTSATAVTIAVYDPSSNLPIKTVDASGVTNLFFYTNTWLLARTELWPSNATAAQAITNIYAYASVTNADGTAAYGLRVQEIRAAGSPDAATNDWVYNSRGFPTQQTTHTGTSDPDVVVTNLFNSRGELVVQTDAAARSRTFSYDPNGKIQSHEIFEAGQAIPESWEFYYYNENGELTWSDGPRFNPEDYIWRDYDGAGRLTTEIRWQSEAKADGSGVQARAGDNLYSEMLYQYDALGNQTKATDPRGNYTLKFYDALGQLLREQFYQVGGVLLATNQFSYNLAGDLTNAANALGGKTVKQYTSTGKPEFQQNPDGSTNAWRYYPDGRIFREIQRNGAFWETTYNDSLRKATKIFYSAAGSSLATNVTVLDRRGNVIQTVDAGGNIFTNLFDGLDRLKISAGPAIVTVSATGMDPNNPVYVTNVLAQITTNFYGIAGTTVTNANALGEKTITFSDALARPTRTEIRNAAGTLVRESSVVYSQDHQSVTVTNGSGSSAIATTAYTDNDGRNLLSISYPNANQREFTLNQFDLAGNLNFTEHASSTNGAVTVWTTASQSFDGINRRISSADRDSALTTYAYNAAGGMTNRTMPGGLRWNASYNNAGQMLQDWNTGADGTGTRTNTYVYYSAGNAWAGMLQTKTDARGIPCTSVYDDWLRPATNTYVVGGGNPDTVATRQYDARGLLTTLSESHDGYVVTISRTFDAYGQMADESVLQGYDGSEEALFSTADMNWDPAGRRTGLYLSQFVWPAVHFGGANYNFSWRADGLLAAVVSSAGGGAYGYDAAGVLTNGTVGVRGTAVTARDGMGRPLGINTKVSGSDKLTETLAYTGDGLLSNHTLAREDFTDSRSYTYVNLTRRLTEERLNLDGAKRWTNDFSYDNGAVAGPGALTKVGPASGLASWSGSTDTFSRINTETNIARRLAGWGRVNGPAAISSLLDGEPMPVAVMSTNDPIWTNRWQNLMEVTPGAHQLTVYAAHPSGQFTTNASVWFTNNAAPPNIVNSFDAMGNIVQRLWKNADGSTNRTQTLGWDMGNRLEQVVDVDSQGDGYEWVARYDPLGRQFYQAWYSMVNGAFTSDGFNVHYHYYDPLVEFLEVGFVIENVSGDHTTWKLYGPDLNGRYGGLNGTGGLEAYLPSGAVSATPVISDARGNVLGTVTNGLVTWSSARPTGYGAVPGYRPLSVDTAPSFGQSVAWRGHWPDITGFIYLGGRYYDPAAGRFLSADPVWNGGDPNYYSFCGGDPINSFDPDGRFAGKAVAFFDDPGDAIWGNNIDYANAVISDYRQRQAEAQWYHSLPDDQQFAYNLPIPLVFNYVQFRDAMQSGNYDAAGDSAGHIAGEALLNLMTLGMMKGAPVEQPAPSSSMMSGESYLPGEMLPSGEVAGVGPGAAFNGEIPLTPDLRALTTEAHDLLGFKGKFVSTSIGQYADGSLGIASSDTVVPRVQFEWAEANGIRVVNGEGHAEMTLVGGATPTTGPLQTFEVSTPFGRQVVNGVPTNPNGAMCADCAAGTSAAGASTTTPTVNRLSRNRQ